MKWINNFSKQTKILILLLVVLILSVYAVNITADSTLGGPANSSGSKSNSSSKSGVSGGRQYFGGRITAMVPCICSTSGSSSSSGATDTASSAKSRTDTTSGSSSGSNAGQNQKNADAKTSESKSSGGISFSLPFPFQVTISGGFYSGTYLYSGGKHYRNYSVLPGKWVLGEYKFDGAICKVGVEPYCIVLPITKGTISFIATS